jgi:hypothetical protein
MKKPTPNPPEADAVADADPTFPDACVDTRKLHEAADRALDCYLNPGAHIMATPYTPNEMFFVNPQADTESLLANACESLASATVMLGDFAALLEGTHRKTLLGIAQVVMLGELAIRRWITLSRLGKSPRRIAKRQKKRGSTKCRVFYSIGLRTCFRGIN